MSDRKYVDTPDGIVTVHTHQSAAPARCPTCGSDRRAQFNDGPGLPKGGCFKPKAGWGGSYDPWHDTEPSSETPLQQAVDSMEGPMREPSSESPALDHDPEMKLLRGLVAYYVPAEKWPDADTALDRLTERLRRAEATMSQYEKVMAVRHKAHLADLDRISDLLAALEEIAGDCDKLADSWFGSGRGQLHAVAIRARTAITKARSTEQEDG